MESLYKYLKQHKLVLWISMLLLATTSIALGIQCVFTEDIMALLPESENEAMNITFRKLRVKDKIFVQAFGETDEETEEALTLFLDKVVEKDSADGFVESVLHQLNPLEFIDAVMWLGDHAVSYLDFTEEEMDSLTSVEHIRYTLRAYNKVLASDNGMYLYDLLALDPCGIALSKGQSMLDKVGGRDSLSSLMPKGVAYITPTIGTSQSREAAKLQKHIHQAEKEVCAVYPNVRIYYHGHIIESAGNSRQIREDLLTTVAISLAIALLMLGICFRNPEYLVALVIPVLFGTLVALASIYLAYGGMSIMALGIGAVVLGVALSYAMHVLIHYVYTGNEAETIAAQTRPVLMGSLTTIGAFGGLLMTDSPLLKDFGLFALLTVTGTTLASLIFLPHFLPRNYRPNRKAFAFWENLNSRALDRKPWVVGIVVAVVAVLICFSGKYTFDSDLTHIGYRSPEMLEAAKVWNETIQHGKTQQYFAAMSTDLEEALVSLEAIEDRCAEFKQSGVVYDYTPSSRILPSLERQQRRINHWVDYFDESRQRQVRRNVHLACVAEDYDEDMFEPFYERMAEPAEPELLYEAEMVPDELMCNLIEKVGDYYLVFLPVSTSSEQIGYVKDELCALENVAVLDPFYYTTSLVEMTHKDFNRIMWISSVFVFLLLLVSYRKIVPTLIAFAPMMLSWYAVLGTMALAGQPFNILNIVVSSFIFGIGVDYSIFIMDGLMHADKLGDEYADSSRLLVMHKTAITMSAAVLILCMSSLLFAKHPAINSIAFCSLVGMLTTILLSFTLQPVLYRFYLKHKR